MESFSKLKILQNIGLFSRKFDHETHQFKKSLPQRLKCHLILLFKAGFLFKIFLSNFFGRTEGIQLWIGNMYLYLPDETKSWIGIIVGI